LLEITITSTINFCQLNPVLNENPKLVLHVNHIKFGGLFCIKSWKCLRRWQRLCKVNC